MSNLVGFLAALLLLAVDIVAVPFAGLLLLGFFREMGISIGRGIRKIFKKNAN